jgi:hypothetical protein
VSAEGTAQAAWLGGAADVWRQRERLPSAAIHALRVWREGGLGRGGESVREAFTEALKWSGGLEERAKEAHVRVKVRAPTSMDELEEEQEKLQRRLSRLDASIRAAELKAGGTQADQARLTALGGWQASAWLLALPTDRHLTLPTSDYEIALRMRLGLDVRGHQPISMPCACGVLSPTSEHLIVCRSTGGIIRRHDTIVDAIHTMLREVRLGVHLEPRGAHGFRPHQGLDLRVVYAGQGGRHLGVDVVVAHPMAQSHRRSAMAGEGEVAANAEAAKRGKYSQAILRSGWDFVPAAFETLGAMGAGVQRLVRTAAAKASEEESELRKVSWATTSFQQYWCQRLSITQLKGTASGVRLKVGWRGPSIKVGEGGAPGGYHARAYPGPGPGGNGGHGGALARSAEHGAGRGSDDGGGQMEVGT